MKLTEYLVVHGLATDLFEARGLILSGKVLVNDTPAVKIGLQVKNSDTVRLRGRREFVARSGAKLYPLLQRWNFPVEGSDMADIGSATGGFTQALLRCGAARVLCIDVGYGLLAEELRRNPRVVLLERTHILQLTREALPFEPQHFTADVSFISLRQVLPKIDELRCPKGYTAAALLFKPQFEISREEAPHWLKKGILQDATKAKTLLQEFLEFASKKGWECRDWTPAPLTGRKGNQEYFIYLQKKAEEQ